MRGRIIWSASPMTNCGGDSATASTGSTRRPERLHGILASRMSPPQADIACVADIGLEPLVALFAPYALKLCELPRTAIIPGSYWGESEAGLVGDTLYARSDTPIHSVLHEAAHFVCMDSVRRDSLQRDAGGDHAEENAVCYLQILWAGQL